ncbi:MAG: zinc metalloprotease HtpX [Candidatus Nezhaarchaeota archaeon]|nr:zinc metalloprotease HtpX [Candidatus Nezhaarchaeota archaeon]
MRIEMPRLSLLGLRLAMIGTFAVVTAVATLVLTAVLTWLQIPFFGIYGILGFVVLLHVVQWLIGPYIIEAAYKVRSIDPAEYPWLVRAFENVVRRSGLKKPPKLGIAEIDLPNAFAYGNPLKGNGVAVTRGLLRSLPPSEVEAVLGHEVGHLKHKDVALMMMISILPALIYYIGYSLYISGWLGGSSRDRGGGPLLLLVGGALMVLSFIFNLFVFYFSRLREYYADAHAALSVDNGARNLQRGLVRIMSNTRKFHRLGGSRQLERISEFKAFFISDPSLGVEGYGDVDKMVEEIKRMKPSLLSDLFSTHPHPAKRLRSLDRFA